MTSEKPQAKKRQHRRNSPRRNSPNNKPPREQREQSTSEEVEMQHDESLDQDAIDMELDMAGNAVAAKSEPQTGELTVTLSRALLRKLGEQAREESISVEELVRELLSESVVLRAWEIMERKIQMRGGQQGQQGNHQRGGGNQQGGGHRGHRKGHRGMSHGRYQSIMDDKATFLEYVRNQERNRR